MFKVRKKLPSVESVKEIFPLTSKLAKIKQARDTELKDILLPGAPSGKFILIVGPCSAHCIDATLAYCYEIAKIADKVKDKLFIVPRIFTSKSRSGLGYKGLVHGGLSHGFSNSEFTSHDTGGFGMVEGVLNQREVHYRVLAETGLSGADELVYLDLFEYIADLVSYVSIGARASDSQSHRLFASGLNTPVGIKNNLAGRLDYLNYALDVAHSPQEFSAGGYAVKSKGNKLAHAVLRGYIDS
ncbi:MAG: 3-deoxy-7-phosphoheptulonate synthase, partial [Firmicutes bacterium]|nr:3-deoxy-7-phosphoheptulonate synthase [Bacillota bacterium]